MSILNVDMYIQLRRKNVPANCDHYCHHLKSFYVFPSSASNSDLETLDVRTFSQGL